MQQSKQQNAGQHSRKWLRSLTLWSTLEPPQLSPTHPQPASNLTTCLCNHLTQQNMEHCSQHVFSLCTWCLTRNNARALSDYDATIDFLKEQVAAFIGVSQSKENCGMAGFWWDILMNLSLEDLPLIILLSDRSLPMPFKNSEHAWFCPCNEASLTQAQPQAGFDLDSMQLMRL